MPLNEKQQLAFEVVFNNKLSIITGCPGVGKTFALKAIVDNALQKNMRVTLASPTGKASKAMQSATGHPASTIHRMLSPMVSTDPATGKVIFAFKKNATNPISTDLLILDEVSMLTNSLMADVFRAVDFNTTVVFVGDKNQLPSVGAGAVLRDMLASGVVPFVELTEIQRNSGDIVKACHAINNGKFYTPSNVLKPEIGQNLRHIEARQIDGVQSIIEKIVCERMPDRGYDPVWDIQVLSPVNKKTELSCKDLNELLQNKLNPNPPVKGTIFRVGDKIINTKNLKMATPTGKEELVVNGDMGKVLEINNKNIVVEFYDPDRICVVPRKDHTLLLAYAITVHRSQGSEFPVVIIPFHSAFGFFVDKPLAYTALSRGREVVITVGHFQEIRVVTKRISSQERITKLEKLLKENKAEEEVFDI